jgi:hypothetical protein
MNIAAYFSAMGSRKQLRQFAAALGLCADDEGSVYKLALAYTDNPQRVFAAATSVLGGKGQILFKKMDGIVLSQVVLSQAKAVSVSSASQRKREGYLDKQGNGGLRRWVPRFVVLEGDSLAYYATNDTTQPPRGALKVRRTEETSGSARKFAFSVYDNSVQGRGNSWNFSASSESSKSAWISALDTIVVGPDEDMPADRVGISRVAEREEAAEPNAEEQACNLEAKEGGVLKDVLTGVESKQAKEFAARGTEEKTKQSFLGRLLPKSDVPTVKAIALRLCHVYAEGFEGATDSGSRVLATCPQEQNKRRTEDKIEKLTEDQVGIALVQIGRNEAKKRKKHNPARDTPTSSAACNSREDGADGHDSLPLLSRLLEYAYLSSAAYAPDTAAALKLFAQYSPVADEQSPRSVVVPAFSLGAGAGAGAGAGSGAGSSRDKKENSNTGKDIGIQEADFVETKWTSDAHLPAFFLVLHHPKRTLLLSIRGAADLNEVIHNLTLDVAGFLEGTCLDGYAPTHSYAHKVLAATADALYDRLFVTIRNTLRQQPGYNLHVTGHSLGAGIGALFTMLLLHRHPRMFPSPIESTECQSNGSSSVPLDESLHSSRVAAEGGDDGDPRVALEGGDDGDPSHNNLRCYCFGPPAVVTAALSQLFKHRAIITSVSMNYDMVPRFTIHSLRALLTDVLAFRGGGSLPKVRTSALLTPILLPHTSACFA